DLTTIYAPGHVWSINPTTGAATKLADVPEPANGWWTRVHWFDFLGGVVFLPTYDTNLLFIPTR
ncbi:MAG: hypothetical protein RLZZ373_2963, partial [Pseudomonadota bacterium]